MGKKVARTCSKCGAIFQRDQSDVTIPMLCGGKVCRKDGQQTAAQPPPAAGFVATSVTAAAVRDAEGNIELEPPVVVESKPEPDVPPEAFAVTPAGFMAGRDAPATGPAGGMSKEEMMAKLAARVQDPGAAGAAQGVATCAMCGQQFDAAKSDPRAVSPMCPECMASIPLPPADGQPSEQPAPDQAPVPVSGQAPTDDQVYPAGERPRVVVEGAIGPHNWIRFTTIEGGVAYVLRHEVAAVETLDLASGTSRVWTKLPVQCKCQFDVVGTPDEIFKLLPGR